MEPRDAIAARLAAGGFVSADAEAAELMAAAAGDEARLGSMLERRLTGEPLAWITGTTTFCGLTVRVDPGVYVPRPQSELVAERAARRLPEDGIAVDLCTGAGAIAMTLAARRPAGRVVASDIDPAAIACATANGVDALLGDLFDPLPAGLAGRVNVVVAAVPYVPTAELGLLQRDTFTFEPALFYDGGRDGADILRQVIARAPQFLRPGGALVLELGGAQAEVLRAALAEQGYGDAGVLLDEDGDLRGIEATLMSRDGERGV